MLDVDIHKSLGDFQLDASFTAAAGLTAIFGPSGAGKTTVAKILAGLETPDTGHIRIDDHILYDDNRNINVPPHKRDIGFVFQEHRLFPHYSVRGNLLYGASRNPSRDHPITFDAVTDLLGLAALLDRRPHTLSLGEKQRVAIGRALMSKPNVLIMDEPLSSLDTARKQDIMPLIKRLKGEFGLTIIYISHSLAEITQLADNLVLMDRGQVKAAGPISDLLNRLELFPYTGGDDAGSIIDAKVVGHDRGYHLSELETAGGAFFIPACHHEIGGHLRIRIRARDVALASSEPKDVSILNRFKGKVVDHRSGKSGMEELLIDVGFLLTARITRKSFEKMNLRTGSDVWTLIKSVTINTTETDVLHL